jgi:hypothetical protein
MTRDAPAHKMFVNASQMKIVGSSHSAVACARPDDAVWSEPCRDATKPTKSITTSADGTATTAHERDHTIHSR